MKIEGLFLSSRAGRRVFWTLLAAAAVPLFLFGLLTHDALDEFFVAQAYRQNVQATKFAGLGVLDRLVVARTVLETVARAGQVDVDARIGNRRGRVLADVATVDRNGRKVDGSTALWQRWQDVVSDDTLTGPAGIARLHLANAGDPSTPLPVLLAIRVAGQPDRTWLAEVDPAFLFGELSADATEERICVVDSHQRPLFCPWIEPRALGLVDQRQRSPAKVRATWNLFLRSDFGADDWTLINLTPRSDPMAQPDSLARMAALGTLATLLIVVMLSLIQVRRTMVPLERLLAGTRRLSGRDYSVRVRHDRDDEFGELSRSFNHMAERIGAQVEAMQVQSSIDREILSGLDVARILQQVARRLAQLAPGAEVAVVELDRGSRMLARVHFADGAFSVVSLPRVEALCAHQTADRGGILLEDPPQWLTGVMRRPAQRVQMQCARAGDELLALLLLGVDGAALDDPDALREVDELSDRVSVTLAAADRERRLVERASHDSLTGLVNRAGLYEALEERLAGPGADAFTLLFVDLDRFKDVNDSLGHQAGDQLLRAVAQQLVASAPAGTLIARPGGDEFVLVVSGLQQAAQALARALCDQLALPVPVQGRNIVVGASIGMAHYPDHGRTTSDLMRRADMAMYAAKAEGGGRFHWFDSALDERQVERGALLADLAQALKRGQFELRYQPRVGAGSGTIRCAEALLRWRHPELGRIMPKRFIGLLEETGLIESVGLWVIDTACRQLVQWRRAGLRVDTIAVNVSSCQLQCATFVDDVLACVRRQGLRPGDVELEITESVIVREASGAIAALRRLHEAGLQVALDDFGTGYSSLSYLHKLPIDVLKIDRSFVRGLGSGNRTADAVTTSIIALARALHMRLVAEGIEMQAQADRLIELGCDELQGYLFSRPLAADEFAAFVRRRTPALAN